MQSIDHLFHRSLEDKYDKSRYPQGGFCLRSIVVSLRSHRVFLFSSIAILLLWCCLCVYAAQGLVDFAEANPDSRAEQWLRWLDAAGEKFRLMGSLFAFSVVFRFNRCYDRWNQGRIFWGNIISTSSNITRMASNWILDDELKNRFCRFVVVFAYSSKALLRGNSLADDEEGEGLIRRDFLTREEMDDMSRYIGWEPQYCLNMLDAIWIEADGSIMFDSEHKVHPQLFRALDSQISKLGSCLGDAISLRASGLPETYDSIQYLIFFSYFILSSVFNAGTLGWVLPILMSVEAFTVMLINLLGSDLVQPFGHDKVDLPIELFCQTIESRTVQICAPGQCQNLKRLAQRSNTSQAWTSNVDKSQRTERGIKNSHRNVSSAAAPPHPTTSTPSDETESTF
jgi:ion channel-forming bestrophin family protein